MTSEARDKIRELRLVAAQCYKMAADAIAARDEAVRNLGKALLDVPAGDWPGAVVPLVQVQPTDPDVCSEGARLCTGIRDWCNEEHKDSGWVKTHNKYRWPRKVPAVEPPPGVDCAGCGAE